MTVIPFRPRKPNPQLVKPNPQHVLSVVYRLSEAHRESAIECH